MIQNRLMIALFFFGWTTAGAAEQPTALVGILTQITGAVQVIGQGAARDPLASRWQVVRAGATVLLPADGAAGIVCSNLHFVRLHGPRSWVLTPESCALGEDITQAEYRLVAPEAGRFKVIGNGGGDFGIGTGVGLSMGLGMNVPVLERTAHYENPDAPLTFGPRGIWPSRPPISWFQASSASEYRLTLSGPGVFFEKVLKTKDISCGASPRDICTFPWPVDQPDLPPGTAFSFEIAARDNRAEPWQSNEPLEVRTPTLAAAKTLEDRLHRIKSLGWLGGTRETVQAGLFAEAGLYTDAAEAYRRALAAAPHPATRVTLADVYLASGLSNLAEPRYREALLYASPVVQAAANFGLGSVEYARGRYQEATQLFQRAHERYAEFTLCDEAEASRLAADMAAARFLYFGDLAVPKSGTIKVDPVCGPSEELGKSNPHPK